MPIRYDIKTDLNHLYTSGGSFVHIGLGDLLDQLISGEVNGPGISTQYSIARWADTNGMDLLSTSNATINPSGILSLTATDITHVLAGAIRIGNTNELAPVSGAGALRYSAGTLQVSDGAVWQNVNSNTSEWHVSGNGGTNPAVNFIGTTDAQDFVLRTNSIPRVTVDKTGPVTISSSLEVTSGITLDSLTASTVLIADASKNITSSSVSSTTLSYLDVTSSIQNQLDDKANKTLSNLTAPTAINQSLLFGSDGSYNIGSPGDLRPNDVHIKNSIVIGSDTNLYREAVNSLKTDSSFVIGGGLSIKRSSTAVSKTLGASDCYLGVDTTNLVVVTLPLANSVNNGKVYFIKDETGNASVNKKRIQTQGADNLDGGSYFDIITGSESITVIGDGASNWFII